MRRAVVGVVILVVAALAGAAPAMGASGVEHLHFAAGPYTVTPGANAILTDLNEVPKPLVNGFMTRVARTFTTRFRTASAVARSRAWM